jgi:site-specific recombinase XerD
VTTSIGRPDITRVHSLRHLFSTRAQEAGVNPLVVQQMLGHTTLEMTGRYTHLSIDAQRRALELIGVPPHG